MHCSTGKTDKIIKNTISHNLSRLQDITPTEINPPRESITFRSNQESNSPYDVNLTTSWQTDNFGAPQHHSGEAYHFQV